MAPRRTMAKGRKARNDAFDLAAVVGIGVVALVVGAGTAGTRLSGSFGDVVVGLVGGGPALGGSREEVYASTPTASTNGDVTVSALSTEQKALVSSAMMAWVSAPPIR